MSSQAVSNQTPRNVWRAAKANRKERSGIGPVKIAVIVAVSCFALFVLAVSGLLVVGLYAEMQNPVIVDTGYVRGEVSIYDFSVDHPWSVEWDVRGGRDVVICVTTDNGNVVITEFGPRSKNRDRSSQSGTLDFTGLGNYSILILNAGFDGAEARVRVRERSA